MICRLSMDGKKLKLPEKKKERDIEINHFHAWFHDFHVLQNINLTFSGKSISCIVGPSGSGKSSLIRCINRINDDTDGFFYKGNILFGKLNVYDNGTDVNHLRTQVGMVFQKPCVFPKSIYENVLFGIKYLRKLSRDEKYQIVENNLRAVSLWKEVSDRLHKKAITLSLGQQQKLSIARTLALEPKVLLLDEPTSSLDPISTNAIENLILRLKEHYTIIYVTHNIDQARRLADYMVFMCNSKVIEHGAKEKIFTNPDKQQTLDYLNHEFCAC